MASRGYFLITDVSGYTAFMTGSELEHAQDILSNLLGAVLDQIRPPLVVSNFQGDAILCYAPEDSFARGQTLLESVEALYAAFLVARERMRTNVSCDCCRACSNVGSLDLKAFVHHGEYVLQRLGGREELSGPDVIVAHRLMKNDVREATGLAAYLVITQQAASALSLGPLLGSMRQHAERYEHVGEVGMYVHDLAAAWERDREARRVYVGAAPGLAQASVELPVGPAVAWEYLTAPELRARWEGADGMSVAPKKDSRVGEGSVVRCVRGKRIEDFPIVDWRPFEYFTEEHRLPWVGKVHRTTELSATSGGTRVSWRYSRPLDGGLASAMLGRVASRLLAGALERDARALLAMARSVSGKPA